jgi:hypothetical protein
MRVLATSFLTAALLAGAACGGHSNRSPSAPTGPPALTAITPPQVSIGDSITLTGSGFTTTTNAIRIGSGYIQGGVASGGTSVTFVLPSVLTVCPPWAQVCITLAIVVTPGTYQVAIVNANGTSNELPLRVVARE